MKKDLLNARLTKSDREWLHKATKAAIAKEPPKTLLGKLLRELAEGYDATMSKERIIYGKTYDDICTMRDAKNYRSEYQRLKVALHRMKKQKLIELNEHAGKMWVELTDKGAAEALRNEILNADKKLSNGTFCYVAFDFPQEHRKLRNNFRVFLKQAGFAMTQLSVWKSNKDIAELVRLFVKRSDAARWVTVIVGKED